MLDENGRRVDLNRVHISEDCGSRELANPTLTSGVVTCHFRDVAAALAKEIESHDVIAGCVAWLTEPNILRAMAGRKGARIIVQKEDFLRPDSGGMHNEKLRNLYSAIPGLDRWAFPGVIHTMNSSASDDGDAVRCVGVANRNKSFAMPRMHHKFLVFGRLDPSEHCFVDGYVFVPLRVWTGSFNFTDNGRNSLENAVLIDDPAIAAAYLAEFENVAALSEPLNWDDEWVAPEWRIGT